MEVIRVMRKVTAAERRHEKREERKALADFRAMSDDERKRLLEAMRRITR